MNDSINEYVLDCRKVGKEYQDGQKVIQVLDDVSFQLRSGESLVIMGSSGSGKSTLLNLLGGLDRPSSGEILLKGQSLSALPDTELAQLRNQHLGFVYQLHHLLMEFSAMENVAMPLMIRGQKKSLAEAEAVALLERVGLSHRLTHKPSALSGGERQRVAIARALVTRPSCVLMDEPTGNLDTHTADSVLQLICELQEDLSISFVVVTHDVSLAQRIGPILMLANGKLVPHK